MSKLPNITENFALNFINSRVYRNNRLIEFITDLDSLREWAVIPLDNDIEYNTNLSVFNTCLDDVESLDEIIEFRDSLHGQLTKIAQDKSLIDDLKKDIEGFITKHPFTIIFVDNHPLFVPVESGTNGIRTLMYLSLTEIIKSDDIKKLSCCANENCPLIFINHTGRRKWCSMKLCGNRNKVEKFLNKSR